MWVPLLNAILLAVFAGTALLIAAIGIYGVIACSIPARQASRVDPIVALRTE
jgi:ABC-type antimicrobial peptide transport system permease subunit